MVLSQLDNVVGGTLSKLMKETEALFYQPDYSIEGSSKTLILHEIAEDLMMDVCVLKC